MAKIYASGNYVIVDDGVKVHEYAKKAFEQLGYTVTIQL